MGFAHLIIHWYKDHKRDLPWRHTNDPYHIWISEVILQQTRVDQGLDYYNRFLERFPDITSLAMAEEEEVMKMWQGLGYYTRARNLHQAARTICEERQSVFPASFEEIKQLRGLGDYSSSAIASIAFGEAQPVIDGNVMRVVSRYKGIHDPVNTASGKKEVKNFLLHHIDAGQPGIFNQAVMELGALVCRPRQPLCAQCPLSASCTAFCNNLTDTLPVTRKTSKITVRHFYYLVIISGENSEAALWMRKRVADDIWKNLYDFPLIETDLETGEEALMKLESWKYLSGSHQLTVERSIRFPRYMLSHRELRVTFLVIRSENYFHKDFIMVPFLALHNYPVSRLIENFLKKLTS